VCQNEQRRLKRRCDFLAISKRALGRNGLSD
jgi:hypothetical protein